MHSYFFQISWRSLGISYRRFERCLWELSNTSDGISYYKFRKVSTYWGQQPAAGAYKKLHHLFLTVALSTWVYDLFVYAYGTCQNSLFGLGTAGMLTNQRLILLCIDRTDSGVIQLQLVRTTKHPHSRISVRG